MGTRDAQRQQVQRRLAAILVADVAGYSRLMGEDEEATLAALKAHRRERIEPAVAAHGGRLVKTTGDGMLVEFASPVEAVLSAVSFQQAIGEHNAELPPDSRLEFRVGINLGDVIVDDGDLFGDGVNVAARVEAMADPGGILVSGAVHDQIRKRVPYLTEFRGNQRVKNIAEPVTVYRVLSDRSSRRRCAASCGPLRRPWAVAAALSIAICGIGAWLGEGAARHLAVTLARPSDAGWSPTVVAPLAEVTVSPPAAGQANPGQSVAARFDAREMELAYWKSIKDATSMSAFQAYLKRYPSGEFAEIASLRIKELGAAARSSSEQAKESPPPPPQRELARVVEQPASLAIPASVSLEAKPNAKVEPSGTGADQVVAGRVRSFDGVYIGHYVAQSSVSFINHSDCLNTLQDKRMLISGHNLSLPYEGTFGKVFTARIEENGVVSTVAENGSVHITGKVVGDVFTADAWDQKCFYKLVMQRADAAGK